MPLQRRAIIARQRAIEFLVSQRIDERRSADGRSVGVQATLATGPDGDNPIELYSILDGLIVDPQNVDIVALDAAARELWTVIANTVRDKLGFPLEPELFSNMLVAAQLGDCEEIELQRIVAVALRTFRDSDVDGLYHFFTSLRFACDVDCTGMAARARIVTRDVDVDAPPAALALRRITSAILRSAAVADVAPQDNRTHGKDNGPLRRHVFKVYLDDHEVQGRALDRGLKNNPVVVANALYPVLFEIAHGLRGPDDIIALKEYTEGSETPRRSQATVAQIVAANIGYATGFLASGDWRDGCRYYRSPDAFLLFYSELVHEFPALLERFGAAGFLRDAIEYRRHASASRPLELAMRAIAARNVGIDPQPELEPLIAAQARDGSWPGFDPLYTLGTASQRLSVHFGSPLITAAFCIRALGPDFMSLSAATFATDFIDAIADCLLRAFA
jgi:hypothetical protein